MSDLETRAIVHLTVHDYDIAVNCGFKIKYDMCMTPYVFYLANLGVSA